jgi:hypothetical protein
MKKEIGIKKRVIELMSKSTAGFKIESSNNTIFKISYDGKPITVFNCNNFEVANRPYLFPVYSPSGISVTRHYPMEQKEGETSDHPHHTGVWTAWGDVNGTDNWAKGEKKGKQIVKSIKHEIDADGVIFHMDIDWTTPDDKPQLFEHRTIRIFSPDKFPSAPSAFIYEFSVNFQAKYGPVKFGDTKEGGLLSVRVATPLDVPKGGKITNGAGKISSNKQEEKNVWGKRAMWCNYGGLLEGKPVGITIIDHPKNPVSPTYWHVRNYGLMTANPFGKSHFVFPLLKGTYRLPANRSCVWRYRLVVYDGQLEQIPISQIAADFN